VTAEAQEKGGRCPVCLVDREGENYDGPVVWALGATIAGVNPEGMLCSEHAEALKAGQEMVGKRVLFRGCEACNAMSTNSKPPFGVALILAIIRSQHEGAAVTIRKCCTHHTNKIEAIRQTVAAAVEKIAPAPSGAAN